MSQPNEPTEQKIEFYVTHAYPCSYLANKEARNIIASPAELVNTPVYSALIQQGFRRSGGMTYKPYCDQCNACIPARLVVAAFKPSKSQKRALKQHANLSATIIPATLSDEHFALYDEYQRLRHPEEFKSADTAETRKAQYKQFLCESHVDTRMIEFRDENKVLKAVSVIDCISDGFSAVYTYYDATDIKASYGTYVVVWLAQWTNSFNLPYLYLGYWIEESQKMAYKAKFKPQQQLIDGAWSLVSV